MQALLNRIGKLYVEEIPKALQSVPRDLTLYAAFVPYFGWEAGPEDYAEHGRTLYILDTNHLAKIKKEVDGLDEISWHAYSWREFIGGKSIMMDSKELSEALLEWYAYQIDQDESAEILDRIGATVSRACRTLNEKGWSGDKYTEDFVVFTDCTADADYHFGVKASVTDKWVNDKLKLGMFTWLRF